MPTDWKHLKQNIHFSIVFHSGFEAECALYNNGLLTDILWSLGESGQLEPGLIQMQNYSHD